MADRRRLVPLGGVLKDVLELLLGRLERKGLAWCWWLFMRLAVCGEECSRVAAAAAAAAAVAAVLLLLLLEAAAWARTAAMAAT